MPDPLRDAVIADACRDASERSDARTKSGTATVVLEPGDGGQIEDGVGCARELADGPRRSGVGTEVQQPQAGVPVALGVERCADELVSGAHREKGCAALQGAVQAPAGVHPPRREGLRTVLPTSQQVDV